MEEEFRLKLNIGESLPIRVIDDNVAYLRGFGQSKSKEQNRKLIAVVAITLFDYGQELV